MLWVALKRECNTIIGHNKLYRLKAQIEYDHPELFTTSKSPNAETPDKDT